MLLSLALLVAVGLTSSASQHARGAPPAAPLEEERRKDDGGSSSRFLASLVDYGIKNETEYASCPEGYPAYGRLGDLLTAWSPNQPEVPEGVVIERLQVSVLACRQSAVFFLSLLVVAGVVVDISLFVRVCVFGCGGDAESIRRGGVLMPATALT